MSGKGLMCRSGTGSVSDSVVKSGVETHVAKSVLHDLASAGFHQMAYISILHRHVALCSK
jgi:hypothetical protein